MLSCRCKSTVIQDQKLKHGTHRRSQANPRGFPAHQGVQIFRPSLHMAPKLLYIRVRTVPIGAVSKSHTPRLSRDARAATSSKNLSRNCRMPAQLFVNLGGAAKEIARSPPHPAAGDRLPSQTKIVCQPTINERNHARSQNRPFPVPANTTPAPHRARRHRKAPVEWTHEGDTYPRP